MTEALYEKEHFSVKPSAKRQSRERLEWNGMDCRMSISKEAHINVASAVPGSSHLPHENTASFYLPG